MTKFKPSLIVLGLSNNQKNIDIDKLCTSNIPSVSYTQDPEGASYALIIETKFVMFNSNASLTQPQTSNADHTMINAIIPYIPHAVDKQKSKSKTTSKFKKDTSNSAKTVKLNLPPPGQFYLMNSWGNKTYEPICGLPGSMNNIVTFTLYCLNKIICKEGCPDNGNPFNLPEDVVNVLCGYSMQTDACGNPTSACLDNYNMFINSKEQFELLLLSSDALKWKIENEYSFPDIDENQNYIIARTLPQLQQCLSVSATEIQSRLDASQSQNTQLQAQMQAIQDKNSALQSEIEASHTQHVPLQDQNARLQTQLAELQDVTDECNTKLKRIQTYQLSLIGDYNKCTYPNSPILTTQQILPADNAHYAHMIKIQDTESVTFTVQKQVVCDVVLVGGGGSGGSSTFCMTSGGSGGGGGQVAYGTLTLLPGVYTVKVGAGGESVRTGLGKNGEPTSITGLNVNEVAIGGGAGGGATNGALIGKGVPLYFNGNDGGCGGGSGYVYADKCATFSATPTPKSGLGTTTSPHNSLLTYIGNDGAVGGSGTGTAGGGGGGGGKGISIHGGDGFTCPVNLKVYANGGGGGANYHSTELGTGNLSNGGGNGAAYVNDNVVNATDGAPNTGSGGGGGVGGDQSRSGKGGNGIAVIYF